MVAGLPGRSAEKIRLAFGGVRVNGVLGATASTVDREWLELMLAARRLGISLEDVRAYLFNTKCTPQD